MTFAPGAMDTLLEEVAEVRDYAMLLVLIAGAISWGVVVRTLPRRRRAGRSPTVAALVVTFASVGGLLGLLGLGFAVALFRDRPPDLDLGSLFAAFVGGIAGWVAGAIAGRRLAQSDERAGGETAALVVLVFVAVTIGALIVVEIRDAGFGPAIDGVRPGHPKLLPLEIAAGTGTAVLVGTLIWLAMRRVGSPPRSVSS